jgi:hypothetical protein
MAYKNPPEHTRFKKGQSGNPKGAARKLPELNKILAEVLGEEKDGVTAAQAIMGAMRAKAAKGDVRAAEMLMDRAYGKPKQRTEVTGLDGAPIQTDLTIKQHTVVFKKFGNGDHPNV